MTVPLSNDIERQIESRVRDGKYASAEDLVGAALKALAQDEARGEFAAGEWDALFAEGEAGGDDLDGETVFAELRALHHA